MDRFVEPNNAKHAGNMWGNMVSWLNDPKEDNNWAGYGPMQKDPKFFTKEDWEANPDKHPTVKPRWQSWFESGGFKPSEPLSEGAVGEIDPNSIDQDAFNQGFQNVYAQQMSKYNQSAQPQQGAGQPQGMPPEDEAMLSMQQPNFEMPAKEFDFKPLAALGDAWSDKPSNVAGSIKSPMSDEERALAKKKIDDALAARLMAQREAKLSRDQQMEIAKMNNDTRVKQAEMSMIAKQQKQASTSNGDLRLSSTLLGRHKNDLFDVASSRGLTPEQVHFGVLEYAKAHATPDKPAERIYAEQMAEELKAVE